jgi:hypothetical protein
MAGDVTAPFSARNRGVHVRINNDFPASARVGLLHLLGDLIGKNYIGSWPEVAKELQRIARLERVDYAHFENLAAESASKTILLELRWERVYDFCERLYSRLAKAFGYVDKYGEYVEEASRGDVQQYIAAELQLLFLEEGLAF